MHLRAIVFAAVACAGAGVAAQQPPAAPAAATTPRLTFTGDVGMVLWTVRQEGAGDFEAFLAKMKEALARGTKPEHARMLASWKLFKVTEGAQAGQVLYATIVNPAVKAADYDPVKIVSDVMPADSAALYPKFKEAVISVNRANLVDAATPAAAAPAKAP